MRILVLFPALLITIVLSSFELKAQETEVLSQSESPISIQRFNAEYQEDSRYSSEGIRYEVMFQNTSAKQIVAYSIGFYAFDVFNRSLGRPLSGFSIQSIDVNGREEGAWLQRASSASLFRDYGTAVSYVERVRFEDGVIWEYDSEEILNQLQRFEESLTIEDLQDGEN